MSECKTPGAVYRFEFKRKHIAITVRLPVELNGLMDHLLAEGAKSPAAAYEDILHGALEDAIARILSHNAVRPELVCDHGAWRLQKRPDDRDDALSAAAAARPVPQAGEVVGRIVKLLRDPDLLKQICDLDVGDQTAAEILAEAADLLTAQAAVLAAKDAEIARLKTALGAADGDVICWHRQAEQAQARQQELEAALRPFAEIANKAGDGVRGVHALPDTNKWTLARVSDVLNARAALAPAGKEPDQP